MFDVALIRHPAVVVPPGTCYGRREVPLAPGWQYWLESLFGPLEALSPLRIWSSPATRCATVASQLSQRLQQRSTIDNRLLELNFGDWEGQCWDSLPRASLDLWAADPLAFSAPGGESGAALVKRVTDFGRTLTEEALPCIVISHGGPLRLLGAQLRGEKPDLMAAPPRLGQLEIVGVVPQA